MLPDILMCDVAGMHMLPQHEIFYALRRLVLLHSLLSHSFAAASAAAAALVE
jgi:hypothetical protein